MDEMKQEHESIKKLPKVTFKEMLVSPALRSPLIIGKDILPIKGFSRIRKITNTSFWILNPNHHFKITLKEGPVDLDLEAEIGAPSKESELAR